MNSQENLRRRIASFDIFDSIVVRRQGLPPDLFGFIGRRLCKENLCCMDRWDFAVLRQRAEECARSLCPSGEPTLEEIYEIISSQMAWSSQEKQVAMAIELEFEDASLCTVVPTASAIEAERKAGRDVWFISDTYLPTSFLRKVLIGRALARADDRIWASCEERASKHRGTIFPAILAKTEVPAYRIFHRGDNIMADVKRPKQFGIDAVQIVDTQLNRYESIIAARGHVASEHASLSAGASRIARLSIPGADPPGVVARALACSLVGPLFFDFTLWCLKQAQALRVSHLFFLARDGQILNRIAKQIAAAFFPDVGCHYLHASRQAWNLAGMLELSESDLSWILEATHGLTIEGVLKRVACCPEDFEPALSNGGLRPDTWQHAVTSDSLKKLAHILITPRSRLIIQARAQKARSNTIAYLRQEGVTAREPIIIVDLGWRGSMQRCLDRLLTSIGNENTTIGLYFDIDKPICRGKSRLLSYVKMACAQEANYRCLLNRGLLELLASADHGGTFGYEVHSDGIKPLLSSRHNDTVSQDFIRAMHDGALAYTKAYIDSLLHYELEPECITDRCLSALDELTTHPSFEEAELCGSQWVVSDQAGTGAHELAPKLNLIQALKYVLFDIRSQTKARWSEGIIARSTYATALIVSARLWLRKLRQTVPPF